jgi:hypothetical protein
MGNCLVTKLKEVVNNPELLKFDEFMLQAKYLDVAYQVTNYNRLILNASSNGPVTVTCIGDGEFTVQGDATSYTTYTIPANTELTFFFTNGTYKVKISGKQNITHISATGWGGSTDDGIRRSLFLFDMGQIKYLQNMFRLMLQGTGSCSGSFEIAAPLAQCNIAGNANIYGDVTASMSNNTALQYIYMSSTKISLDLTSLYNKQNLWAIGLPSGTIVNGDLTDLCLNCSKMNVIYSANKGTTRSTEVNDFVNAIKAQYTDRDITIDFGDRTTLNSWTYNGQSLAGNNYISFNVKLVGGTATVTFA